MNCFFLLYFFSLAQIVAIFHQKRLTLRHVLYFNQCLVATFVSLTRPLRNPFMTITHTSQYYGYRNETGPNLEKSQCYDRQDEGDEERCWFSCCLLQLL